MQTVAECRLPAGLGDNVLEVMWSAPCSPRLALLRHRQDAVLECELYAPAGTSLVWFKDEAQVLPEVCAALMVCVCLCFIVAYT